MGFYHAICFAVGVTANMQQIDYDHQLNSIELSPYMENWNWLNDI